MIDRVAADLGRELLEVPVGFKWFVPGLAEGSLDSVAKNLRALRSSGETERVDNRQGRHPPGPSRRRDTSRDRIVTERAVCHADRRHGAPEYERIDSPATSEQKERLAALLQTRSPRDLSSPGGNHARFSPTRPGMAQPSAGSRSTTENAWFAARPSGTEDVYKMYAESFVGADHLQMVQAAARDLVESALG